MWGGGGTVNIGRVGAIGKRFLTLSPPLFGLLDDATGEGGSVWSERRLKIFVLISSLTASPPPPPHLLCQGLMPFLLLSQHTTQTTTNSPKLSSHSFSSPSSLSQSCQLSSLPIQLFSGFYITVTTVWSYGI